MLANMAPDLWTTAVRARGRGRLHQVRNHLTGVFIGSHAIAEGVITRKQLRERSYRRLAHGVYADPGLEFDHRLRCAAVALLLPTGTAIGGHSAAAWHGAPFAAPQDPVTVVRPPSVLWKGPREVRVHQAELTPADVEWHDDVPVTSALRTAWDVAAWEPLATAVAALDAMVRSGSVAVEGLAALPAARPGRKGVVRVRHAVALVDPRAESAPESRVRVALVVAGLAPVPQFEVWSAGVLLGRADLAFPEQRVLVEYEGAYHFDGTQIVRDDARIARLEAAGWRVIRLSAADLRDLDGVVARVRAALVA
jgi:G:T-mismatch repair DNA endonuclease (very short patch repair protein)